MKLSFESISLRLKSPVRVAGDSISVRSGWMIVLEAEGMTGRCEAMPLPSHGTETGAQALEALKTFSIDHPPSSLEALETVLQPLRQTPAVRFGLEAALLDWMGQKRSVPVAELLRPGDWARSVPVNALLDGVDAAALSARARQAVEAGFRVLKVKVASRSIDVDAQRLLAVRQAVGADIKIRIDANGAWSEGTARSALRGLSSLDLELCEQPVRVNDIEALRRLRAQVPVSIAADESLSTPASVTSILEQPIAADVLVLKPLVLGGLLPALEVAQRAHAAGARCYVTTSLDGPHARAACVHLAAALPGGGLAHGLSTVELFEGLSGDRYEPAQGSISVTGAPGLGLTSG